MAKKLLVRTPQTEDGITLQYDDNKQVVYGESIVEPGARKNFESLNASLPEHLRHEFSEIEVDDTTGEPTKASKAGKTKADSAKGAAKPGSESTTAANGDPNAAA